MNDGNNMNPQMQILNSEPFKQTVPPVNNIPANQNNQTVSQETTETNILPQNNLQQEQPVNIIPQQQQPINIIPQQQPVMPTPANNQPLNVIPIQSNTNEKNEELSNNNSNRFINNQLDENDLSQTNINDLNVEGNYNGMEKSIYADDPKVKENMEEHKKKTIPVTAELKTVIVIALILLVFIIFMPNIFDFLESIGNR